MSRTTNNRIKSTSVKLPSLIDCPFECCARCEEMNNRTALALLSISSLSNAFSLHRRMPQQIVGYHSPSVMPTIETLIGRASYYDGRRLLLYTPLTMARNDENDTVEEESTESKIPLVARVESFFDAMLGQFFSFFVYNIYYL